MNMFVKLYKTLIRPIIEYASPVWAPQKVKGIIKIEGIQRRATKLIRNLEYPQRLKRLDLPTLEYRRMTKFLLESMMLTRINSLKSVQTPGREGTNIKLTNNITG